MSYKTTLKVQIPEEVSDNLYYYIFHYNTYENQMYAIHRDYYVKYFENKKMIPKNKIFKIKSYV